VRGHAHLGEAAELAYAVLWRITTLSPALSRQGRGGEILSKPKFGCAFIPSTLVGDGWRRGVIKHKFNPFPQPFEQGAAGWIPCAILVLPHLGQQVQALDGASGGDIQQATAFVALAGGFHALQPVVERGRDFLTVFTCGLDRGEQQIRRAA